MGEFGAGPPQEVALKFLENFMETKTSPAAINTIKVTGTRKSNFSCNFKELLIETRNEQSKLYYQRLTFGREIIHRKGNYWNRWALIGGECVIHDAEKAIERMEMIDEIGKHFFCYPVSRIVKELVRIVHKNIYLKIPAFQSTITENPEVIYFVFFHRLIFFTHLLLDMVSTITIFNN